MTLKTLTGRPSARLPPTQEPGQDQQDQGIGKWQGRIVGALFETNLWILLILGVIVAIFGSLNPTAFLSPFNFPEHCP